MLRDSIRSVVVWLRRAITQPLEELNRWQRAARFAYDLGRYGARQLREDRATQMAAALSFRTLFGLAPVLIVATILVKAFRGPGALLAPLHDLLASAGLDQIKIVPPAGSADQVAAKTVSLAKWLEDLTTQLVDVNLSAAGWVGTALIIYAAIGLMVMIENSFNIIYRAHGGRAWTRRVPLYWFVLTVSPVLVVSASLANNRFADWITSVETWQMLLICARVAWSFGITWLFMFAVYTLVPNAKVALRPGLAGAFVAAVLIEGGKHFLGAYLGSAFAINQLYGSLGLIPLFMFWVYLMWLAVLFGLQVSATLQMLHGRAIEQMEPQQVRPGIIEAAAVLSVVEVVAEKFVKGQPVTNREVAEITSIPESVVVSITDRLATADWLHRVDHPESAISLARPVDQLEPREFIEIGFQMADECCRGRRSTMSDRLRQAQRTTLEGQSLAPIVT